MNKKQIKMALIYTPQITFEVTNRCNLQCKYCCYGDNIKKQLCVLLFFFFTSCVIAQQIPSSYLTLIDKYSIVDTTRYQFIYKARLVLDKRHVIHDNYILQYGHHMSKFYSYKSYLADSIGTYCERTPTDNATRCETIIRNLNSSDLTILYKVNPYHNHFRYYEKPLHFNWAMTNKKKKLMDYNCLSAETNFRGRKYTAWFTLDLPLNAGPWKFSGLPGLILEVTDNTNEVHYICIGMYDKSNNTDNTIKEYKWKYITKSRKTVRKMIKEAFLDPLGLDEKLHGPLNIQMMDGSPIPPNLKIVNPYNPIEKE